MVEDLATDSRGRGEPCPCFCPWDRQFVRKSLLARGNPPFPFYGALLSPIYSTAFDVVIDFSQAQFIPPVIAPFFVVFAAVWVQSAAGAQKQYRAQYQLSVSTGILPVALPTPVLLPPAWSVAKQSGVGGQQFMISAFGVAGCSWGLDIAGFGAGQAHDLVFCGIAHGKEV